ncbi:MAG: restriction endonuclease [Nitrososphaeria archaeon]
MSYFILLKIIPFFKEKFINLNELLNLVKLSRMTVLEALDPLIKNGYVTERDSVLRFEDDSSIIASILALKLGASLNDVLKVVGWRDFENFTERVLLEYGYKTFRNFRLKKPRLEVDVLALKRNFGLVVDCKQWQKNVTFSKLRSAVLKQVERTKTILSYEREFLGDKKLIPVIVVLYPSPVNYIEGVPIVPIEMFKSFVTEIDGRVSEFLKVYFCDGKVLAEI